MSGLAALLAGHNPPDLYQWHSAAHVPDIEHAVEHAGWKFVYLDGWTVEDKQSFLKSTAAAFSFADDLGENFDALSDCLGRRRGRRPRRRRAALGRLEPVRPARRAGVPGGADVLGGRANAERGCTFAAILRGEGPPIDLPELPVKH